MELNVVFLMLLAGAMHAAWHALVKSNDSNATLVGMGLVSALLLSPLIFVVSMPSLLQFKIIIISVLFHGAYKIFLSRSYKTANFSRAYSLSRGLVPILAIPISYVLLNQLPDNHRLLGILVIFLGLMLLYKSQNDHKKDDVDIIYVLLTSFAVSFYSVIDAYGTRVGEGWLSFTIWLVLIDGVAYAFFSMYNNYNFLTENIKKLNYISIVAGLLGTVTFVIFLWALSRGSAPVIIAFRESSIIFSLLIGKFLLREKYNFLQMISSAGIATGLFLLAV